MTPELANSWLIVVAIGSMVVAFFTMALGFLKLLFDVRKVHVLVNDRSERQDRMITKLHEEIRVLHALLATERRINADDSEGNI